MGIFNQSYIHELFGIHRKKGNNNHKEINYDGAYTKIEITSAASPLFDYLYKNEALTAEGIIIKSEEDFEKINNWFRVSSKCSSSNVDIYTFKGKTMNDHYHLTGDNRYKNDITIACIDWLKTKCDPYKGNWRWFSDVVDNNARREIAKGNTFYNHYTSIYYGDMGIED